MVIFAFLSRRQVIGHEWARDKSLFVVEIQPAAAVGALRLAGGGTVSAPWRQLLADVLGRELAAVEVPSASARGAAFLGGRAAGLITDPDRSALRAELGPTTTPSDTALHDRTFAAFQAALSQTRSMRSSSSTASQS
jgi:sugar (pentulose or hexulose) kinase